MNRLSRVLIALVFLSSMLPQKLSASIYSASDGAHLIDEALIIDRDTTTNTPILELDQAGTGDSAILLEAGTQQFAFGVLNSDDSLRISDNATLGTNDRIVILSNGNVGVGDSSPATALEVGGTTTTTSITVDDDTILGSAATDNVTITGGIQGASPLTFEGSNDNGVTTTLAISEPTVNRTITFPDLSGTVMLNLAEDTSPQLGANLDVQTNSIVATGANNIALTPATGAVVLDGLSWPTADGAANSILTTNGAGQLAFQTGLNGDVTSSNVTITGGTIDNTVIGGTTPAAGTFSTLTVTGNTTLGDAATDTIALTGVIEDVAGVAARFEGGAQAGDILFNMPDPAADITITFPNTTDTLATLSDVAGTAGWTRTGTDVHLTTITDDVGIGVAAPALKFEVADEASSNNNILDVARFTRTTSNGANGGNNMGLGLVGRLEDSAGNTDEAGRMNLRWANATDGAEDGRLDFSVAIGGSIPAQPVWSIAQDGHFVPGVNDTYNIGSDTFRPASIYAGANSLHVGPQSGEATNNELLVSFTDAATDLANFNVDGGAVEFIIEADGDATLTGNMTANSFAGGGASLTSLNATNISSGTLADARLSANVPLLNTSNTWSGLTNTFNNALTVSGNGTLGDANTDNLTINAGIQGTNALVFEGSVDNGTTTTFSITNPTANNTYTFRDTSGTVALLSDIAGTAGWTRTGTDVHLTTITDDVGIGVAAPALKFEVADEASSNNNILDVARFTRTTSNGANGGNNMGLGLVGRLEDSAGNTDEAGRMNLRWANATNGAEDGRLDFSVAIGGSIPAQPVWSIAQDGHFIPGADNTYNIGSDTFRPASIYAAANSLHVGPQNGEATNNELLISFTDAATDLANFNLNGGAAEFIIEDDGDVTFTGNITQTIGGQNAVFTHSNSASRTYTFPDIGGTVLLNMSEDTTPQLGGNLDVQTNSIVATGANNIALTPAAGVVVIDGINWPATDGVADSFLGTNGSGQLSFRPSSTIASLVQSSIDHGALSGLGDDDHTQYVLANGNRAFSGSVELAAGTAAANTAPLNFASGTLLTTPENGAMEFNGSFYFLTEGGTRRQVVLDSQDANITSSNATITGGTINGTTIGATTPSTAIFTNMTAVDNVTLGSSAADNIGIAGGIQGGTPLVFEGSLDDGVTTSFAITQPTSNNIITFPDASGTVLTTGNGFTDGGNSFGQAADLGTLDANVLNFVTGTGGPNTRMSIGTTGNITINAATSGTELAVSGETSSTSFQVPVSTSTDPRYSFSGRTDSGISLSGVSSDLMHFITDGGTRMTMHSSGIDILASTGTELEVTGETSSTTFLAPVTTATDPRYSFVGKTDTGLSVIGTSSDIMSLVTDGAVRMDVHSSGVDIPAASGTELEVSGAISTSTITAAGQGTATPVFLFSAASGIGGLDGGSSDIMSFIVDGVEMATMHSGANNIDFNRPTAVNNDFNVTGATTLGDAVTDAINMTGVVQGTTTAMRFEGGAQAGDILFAMPDPAANITLTFPNTTDTLATLSDVAASGSPFTDAGAFIHPTTTTDDLYIGGNTAGTAAHLFFDDGSAVFNEQGANADFRIESDNLGSLFFADADVDIDGTQNGALGGVGIGTSTPTSRLHVATSNSFNSTVVNALSLERQTNGFSAQIGSGVSMDMIVEDGAGNVDPVTTFTTTLLDTSGTPDTRLSLDTSVGGTVTPIVTLDTNGLSVRNGVMRNLNNSASGLDVKVSSTVNSTVLPGLILERQTNSFASQNQVGVGIELKVEDGSNTNTIVEAVELNGRFIDATAGDVDSEFNVLVTTGGTENDEVLTVDGTNGLAISPGILRNKSAASGIEIPTASSVNSTVLTALTLERQVTGGFTAANGNGVGMIFEIEDDGDNIEQGGEINVDATNVAEASTSSQMNFEIRSNNNELNVLTLDGTGATVTGAVNATSFAGDGSSITNLNASNVASGTLASARGGTGVSNAGSLTYGANDITFTTTGATNVTLPTSGTLATLADVAGSSSPFTDAGAFIHPTTTTDDLYIGGNTAGTAAHLFFDDGTVVLNEQGTANGFRVEGDNDANTLVVSAATDRVGIGDSAPDYKLEISDGNTSNTTTLDVLSVRRENTTGATGAAANMGVGVLLEMENASDGVFESVGRIAARYDSVTGAAETTRLEFEHMRAGALVNDWDITAGGHWVPQGGNSFDVGSDVNRIRELYVSEASVHVGPSGGAGSDEVVLQYDNTNNDFEIDIAGNAGEEYVFGQTGNANFAGTMTATSFIGSGANLTANTVPETALTVGTGVAGTVLTSNGVGSAPSFQSLGASVLLNGGNATTNPIVVGSNDDEVLNFETNNTVRGSFGNDSTNGAFSVVNDIISTGGAFRATFNASTNTPLFSFVNDTNTGIYNTGGAGSGNRMRFQTAGTDFLRTTGNDGNNNTTVEFTSFTPSTSTAGELDVTFADAGDNNTSSVIMNGDVTLGSGTNDNIGILGRITTSLDPDSTTLDLGDNALRWRDLFISDQLFIGADANDALIEYDEGNSELILDPDNSDSFDEFTVYSGGLIENVLITSSTAITAENSRAYNVVRGSTVGIGGAYNNMGTGISFSTPTSETDTTQHTIFALDASLPEASPGQTYARADFNVGIGGTLTRLVELGHDTTIFDTVEGFNFLPIGTGVGDTFETRYRELTVNGTNYSGFKAQDDLTNSQVWTLPDGDGANNTVMTTDGSGNLSFQTLTAIGGGNVSGWTDDGADVRLTSAADEVGIGVATAEDKLHVSENVQTAIDTVASVMRLERRIDSGSAGQAGTGVGIDLYAENANNGTQAQIAQIAAAYTDATNAAEDGSIEMNLVIGGSLGTAEWTFNETGLIPGADDTYDIGTSSARIKDIHLGPSSMHLNSTAGETTTARDWNLNIDTTDGATTDGNLRISEATGALDAIIIQPDGDVGIGTIPERDFEVEANFASALPMVKLDQVNDSGDVSILLEGGATPDQQIAFGIDASDGDSFVITDGSALGSGTNLLRLVSSNATFPATVTASTFSGSGASLTNIPVSGLANGTGGQLLSWTAGGVPTTVSAGTAGQVLVANASGPPSFQTAPADNDWTTNIATLVAGTGSNNVSIGENLSSANPLRIRQSGGDNPAIRLTQVFTAEDTSILFDAASVANSDFVLGQNANTFSLIAGDSFNDTGSTFLFSGQENGLFTIGEGFNSSMNTQVFINKGRNLTSTNNAMLFLVHDNSTFGSPYMSFSNDPAGTALIHYDLGLIKGGGVDEFKLRYDDNNVVTNDAEFNFDGANQLAGFLNINVGIGTDTPSTNLDVDGTVRIRGGAPDSGDVLTATDSNGNATWQAPGTPTIQTGQTTLDFTVGGTCPDAIANVTFPVAFSSAPTVMVTSESASATSAASSVTTTGFTLSGRWLQTCPAFTVTYSWIAILP